MEFRLIYDGPLKATTTNNSRVKDKHAIRKQLHAQLAILWDMHPMLHFMKHHIWPETKIMTRVRAENSSAYPADPNVSIMETFARRFSRCGFRFVPLVNKEYKLVCGLDILFLRRESPGDLILRGGDIDNRIKTLLDALRVPADGSELPRDCVPESNETPFCCLLENDSLVTDLKVTTDRLLRPLRDESENESNVVLVIQVHVKSNDVTIQNLPFLG